MSDKNNNLPSNENNNRLEEHMKTVYPISKPVLKNKQKNRFFKKYKPYIGAVFSATAIGIVLGIIMLQLFTVVEGESNVASNRSSSTPSSNQTEEQNENATTIDPLTAYVIQGGVFTEEANAIEWSEIFKEHGIPSVIWEREGEYYLFTHLSSTKEQAVKEAEKIKEKDLDVFVKEWSTDSYEIDLETKDWMILFQETWFDSVQSFDQGEEILPGQWEQLIDDSDNFPNEANNELVERINTMIKHINEDRLQQLSYDLLELWKEYEKVLSSISF